MKPREIAVNVLDEVLYKDGYSNLILNKELNKNNIDPKDKGLITEIVYGTLKQKYSIDKDIELYLDRKLSTLDQHILNIFPKARIQSATFRNNAVPPEFALHVRECPAA